MSEALRSYIFSNKDTVAGTLNGLGLWYLSPCTDVGFKKVMNESTAADKRRAIRFVSAFCKLFDGSNDPSCRMSDNSRILENRTIRSMEPIPESIGYNGEVVVDGAQNAGGHGRGSGRGGRGRGNSTGLPAHPRIDSGFVVTTVAAGENNAHGGSRGGRGGGLPARNAMAPKFKIGIEMQVRDQGNMGARVVDYGTRIFRYEKNNNNVGYLKTYELALVRWGVQNSVNTILSASGTKSEMCDAIAQANMIGRAALCCAQLFLGTAVSVMDVVLQTLNNRHQNEEDWTLDDGDKNAAVQAISKEKNAQRNALITQIRILWGKGRAKFNSWSDKEKDCVNRIGFFKYGHLMSERDVEDLNDEDLKNDYECMKIKEDNIVDNNISDIEAIYGKVSNYDLTILTENERLKKQVADLERQLKVKNQKEAPRAHKKGKETQLVERKVEKSKIKNAKSNGSGKPIKTHKKRQEKSSSSSPSASESSPNSGSKKTNGRKKGK
ncbi:MAG: hypothetical protein LBB18_00610 [Puniceicoccales bacterium]|jgi:hypothetical protein|nr:hypothetical protein [Puniceicoccales bacterium]